MNATDNISPTAPLHRHTAYAQVRKVANVQRNLHAPLTAAMLASSATGMPTMFVSGDQPDWVAYESGVTFARGTLSHVLRSVSMAAARGIIDPNVQTIVVEAPAGTQVG